MRANTETVADKAGEIAAEVAFAILAVIGVERDGYVVTEGIAVKALAAKSSGLNSSETLMRILNG
ncbi:hypothetical protein [Octadecabacter antarcticus]|uniref:hypothetical protein n=1 Tax=Octadecabacter antarcticus TaxID=1217908 RepID=UPI0002D7721C|nr:hypothetical protein [Octadecabacter antarcticus]